MSSSWASAIRCRTPLVEPPEAQTQAIAFSSESRVMTLLGRMSSTRTLITSSPIRSATLPFSSSSAGTIAEPPALIPSASKAQAIVLAVNWPPQAPAPGLATPSSSFSSSSVMSPALWAPIASKMSRIVTSRPCQWPGRDRAAVEDDRGDVEAGQRHRAAGDRLVAGAEGDDRVELVAAGHQLDRVGDHLAADQRGLHPLGAHRDAVGDGDGVELHRRPARGADALFDVLGEAAEVEVAGHRLGPGVGDPDRRPAEGVVVEPDALHVGARVGAVGAVEDDARARAGQAGRGGAVRAHGRESTEPCARSRSKTSTGPGPAPMSRRPAATAAEAISRAAAGGLERALAAGEKGGERRGVGAAGAVRGAVGMALAGDLDRSRRRRRRGRRPGRCGRR